MKKKSAKFKKGNIPWNKGKKGLQKSLMKGKVVIWLVSYQFKSGELHPNWKGGKSRLLHGGKKYVEWRVSVYKRDSFTCVMCGQVGGRLVAHHIKHWAKFPKLRYIINNGITLCDECHKEVHQKNEPEIYKTIKKPAIRKSKRRNKIS